MSMNRRDFLQVLAVAAAGGLALHSNPSEAAKAAGRMYELPRFGQVSLLRDTTDCHAQLLPIPLPRAGRGTSASAAWPARCRTWWARSCCATSASAGHARGPRLHLPRLREAAKTYGKVGGFAHLATLVKQLKASRPGALLLDGGDTWQGSGLSLDQGPGHGRRLQAAGRGCDDPALGGHLRRNAGQGEIEDNDFKGSVDIVAQNIKTADFGDPVFKPYVIRNINGVPVAIVGQAFPGYTPIANPRWQVPNWSYGIQDDNLQKVVDRARAAGAQVVVVLSHNGMDVDLKMASRVRGVDAILGGHTHDGVPAPVIVKNAGGQTLVTNAGSNGKYLGVLDLDVKGGKVVDFRYKLLPVFANLIPADPAMDALIKNARAFEDKLNESSAVTGACSTAAATSAAPGTSCSSTPCWPRRTPRSPLAGLPAGAPACCQATPSGWTPPGSDRHHLPSDHGIDDDRRADQTVLEDVCDNLFNPDPLPPAGRRHGAVGGLRYVCDPNARDGCPHHRHAPRRQKPLEASKPQGGRLGAGIRRGQGHGEPVWDLQPVTSRPRR